MLPIPWTHCAGPTGHVKVGRQAGGVGANARAVTGTVHRLRVTPVSVCVAVRVG